MTLRQTTLSTCTQMGQDSSAKCGFWRISFAPRIDVKNPGNPVIGNRSFGEDQERWLLRIMGLQEETRRVMAASTSPATVRHRHRLARGFCRSSTPTWPCLEQSGPGAVSATGGWA
jgi:hypothetical protein